mmetsp:Transcript_35415/g.86258  ORF Transcript_35415/g.86258 Transcript_35415/m.86258 type:complete len:208 (-) Transcript_35415:1087-1710(-)
MLLSELCSLSYHNVLTLVPYLSRREVEDKFRELSRIDAVASVCINHLHHDCKDVGIEVHAEFLHRRSELLDVNLARVVQINLVKDRNRFLLYHLPVCDSKVAWVRRPPPQYLGDNNRHALECLELLLQAEQPLPLPLHLQLIRHLAIPLLKLDADDGDGQAEDKDAAKASQARDKLPAGGARREVTVANRCHADHGEVHGAGDGLEL